GYAVLAGNTKERVAALRHDDLGIVGDLGVSGFGVAVLLAGLCLGVAQIAIESRRLLAWIKAGALRGTRTRLYAHAFLRLRASSQARAKRARGAHGLALFSGGGAISAAPAAPFGDASCLAIRNRDKVFAKGDTSSSVIITMNFQ